MSQAEFRQIPIAKLTFSQTTAQKERRAHFNKDAMVELASSIAVHGIAQPILVRPKGDAGEFEICAGERRVLAGKQAGLIEVPAMVREISDEQLLELQLIENLQREGLHELAEAEGYEQLMEKFGLNVEQIIAKVGKSRAYVYGRLKLTALCKAARMAFYEGKLNASTATELARIPVESLQQQALKEILNPQKGEEALSVRAAKEHIQGNYMLRLSVAGFATDDATLVAKAGACGPCPKRTGNQPELFGDVKGSDVCTDLACFRSKIAAAGVRTIEEAKKTGQKVIAGVAAVKKIAPYGLQNSTYLQDYVRLNDTSYEHGQKKYSEVLGKDYIPTLLQDPDNGAFIKIAPRSDIPKAKRSGGRSGNSASGRSSTSAQSSAKEKQKSELELRCRKAIFRAALAAAPKKIDREGLQALVENEIDSVCPNDDELVALLGWEKSSAGILARLAKLSDADLAQLACVVSAMDETTGTWGNAPALMAIAKRYRVDVKKVRDRVAAELKAAPVIAAQPKGISKSKKKGRTSPAKKKTGNK